MRLVDALVPLLVGVLLVVRPQLFLKRGAPEEEIAKKRQKLRNIGYVLWGVAVLYALLALLGH